MGADPQTENSRQAQDEEAESIQEDRLLVERAKQGDTEAFGELIERHRHRAHGWAARMTGDPHMADDIVQDALIRTFLHLGSLTDTSRFLPWFHRIVRNQANMRLRRGGPHRHEKPFTSIGASPSSASAAGRTAVEWDDLDSILFHLAQTAADAASREQDPAEHLMRKELYETIHALLHCLSRKERAIFQAYFFRQLSPDEIAAMYHMSTGSIYTYIHRSRQKLRQEHVRVSLGLVSQKKEGTGMGRRKQLALPEWREGPVFSTLASAMGRMLAAAGQPIGAAELMGTSTIAFRMKVSDRTTFADSLFVFDWKAVIRNVMQRAGFEVNVLCGQLGDSPVPLLGAVERFPIVLRMEEAVVPFIRKHIDLEKPVLYFDTLVSRPFVHEWSLIYGYDDEARCVLLTDPMFPEGKRLSYEELVDNPVRFLAGLGSRLDPEANPPGLSAIYAMKERYNAARNLAMDTIRYAIRYARRGCEYRPRTSYLTYTSGLAAYDRWIGHLKSPNVAPNRYGMGHLTAVYAETKRLASQFVRSVPFEEEPMRLALLASEAYEQAADALDELKQLVPFVRSSEVLSAELRERCAVKLEQARTFESAAVGYLEKCMTILTGEEE
ncbi:RNA polymerase sigma factor [Paenibacillus sp. HJGM_3]|uniref:RNA polymerase sigma factor n=1 Tax=Paenibacillus sp. HJGM_3 TaxID=3379816 RepID=UPI00385F522D